MNSDPDIIIVTMENSAPVADAGPDVTHRVGETVQLDGTGSGDADGDGLTFEWSIIRRPLGSTASLSDPGDSAPTLVVDVFGTYVAQLVVRDRELAGAPDTVVITTSNTAPTAHAGPTRLLVVGTVVELNGGLSSDPDGQPLSYSWSLTQRPAKSAAELSDPEAVTPEFTMDVPGTYIFTLVVSDGIEQSAPDNVEIYTKNSPPITDAGQCQGTNVGTSVQLGGPDTGDVDGDFLYFAWSFISRPDSSSAILSELVIPNPTFVPDVAGEYVLRLVASDGKIESDDTVLIRVAEVGEPPPACDG